MLTAPRGTAPRPLTRISVDWTLSSRQFPYMFLEMRVPTSENNNLTPASRMFPRAEGGFYMPVVLLTNSSKTAGVFCSTMILLIHIERVIKGNLSVTFRRTVISS